jgi:transmembrane sensor
MNTQTSLAVPSGSSGTDHVRLIAGEASFTTGSNSARSLTVLAGNGRIVASQARFDVRVIDTVVCVTCLDGAVRIEKGAQAATIDMGRQLSYGGDGLERPVAVDLTEAVSWQDGFLIFRLTPLSAVVAEINRYRPGEVILLDRALGAHPINGRVRIDRIDDALVWIEQAVGATSHRLPGGILLLS